MSTVTISCALLSAVLAYIPAVIKNSTISKLAKDTPGANYDGACYGVRSPVGSSLVLLSTQASNVTNKSHHDSHAWAPLLRHDVHAADALV